MRVEIFDTPLQAVLRDARHDALEDAGLEITRHAQAEAPVGPSRPGHTGGNLRRNIEFEGVNADATEARVVAKAPYSAAQNNGFTQKRVTKAGRPYVIHFRGNPYMNRAVDLARV